MVLFFVLMIIEPQLICGIYKLLADVDIKLNFAGCKKTSRSIPK